MPCLPIVNFLFGTKINVVSINSAQFWIFNSQLRKVLFQNLRTSPDLLPVTKPLLRSFTGKCRNAISLFKSSDSDEEKKRINDNRSPSLIVCKASQLKWSDSSRKNIYWESIKFTAWKWQTYNAPNWSGETKCCTKPWSHEEATHAFIRWYGGLTVSIRRFVSLVNVNSDGTSASIYCELWTENG